MPRSMVAAVRVRRSRLGEFAFFSGFQADPLEVGTSPSQPFPSVLRRCVRGGCG